MNSMQIAPYQKLMRDELTRAAQLYGATNHSDHESYAVIKEEVEEALAEATPITVDLERFWGYVKQNPAKLPPEIQTAQRDIKRGILYQMQMHALQCACEMVQVAAMCEKAMETLHASEDFTDED